MSLATMLKIYLLYATFRRTEGIAVVPSRANLLHAPPSGRPALSLVDRAVLELEAEVDERERRTAGRRRVKEVSAARDDRDAFRSAERGIEPVSYTHLTLPTICSV